MSDPLWRTGRWSDEHVELFIGNLLRWGVVAAALVAAAGGALYLARHGNAVADYHVFHGQPASLTSVRSVFQDALRFQPIAIIQFGLLLLILTPIARVALSLIAFIKQHDRTYVVVTLIVLGLLLYGLTGAAV